MVADAAAGPNLATPLVHDGVVFVHSYNDNVQALDAATGDELWHYARRLPAGARPSVKRNIALYGDKLYLGTSDVHVIALDVRTGKVVWDRAIAKPGGRWGLTGGPLVATGKVMQGVSGQGPGGAFIVALDAQTGVEAWRFYTVARPDAAGGNSWNGLPLEKRTGGSVWTAGSYDAELSLAFFGPAPTYDTAPLRDLVHQPGVTNNALYTDTTIAINPDTGEPGRTLGRGDNNVRYIVIMIRTQISLSAHEYRAAKREASRLGISLAELLRRSLQSILPADSSKPWMRYAGMIETGDPASSQHIDEVVYGQKD